MSRVFVPFAWAGDVIQCTVATTANGDNRHSCDNSHGRVTRVKHSISRTLVGTVTRMLYDSFLLNDQVGYSINR